MASPFRFPGLATVVAGALALSACDGPDRRGLAGPLADVSELAVMPRLLTRPTAIVFWLPAADTLVGEARTGADDQVRQAASELGELLRSYDIPVVGTNSARVYVAAPDAPRRTVMLEGLDYPYGVVLVDPGYPEQIITGPSDQGELHDLAWDYFLLDEGAGGDARTAVYEGLCRFRAAFHATYAGMPRLTSPSPSNVRVTGCDTMALPTIAAADRTKRAGVTG